MLAYSWLLLIHQLPAKPAYLRVKTWRRLQDIGAVAVKNAVHALPMNEETQEDFEWLLREIREGGGEAFVCEARLIDGLSDEEVRALFDRARDADYAELAKEAQAIAKAPRRKGASVAATELRAQVARLRKRLAEIAAVDFFGAIGRETTEELLRGLETQLEKDQPVAAKTKTEPNPLEKLRNRTWVTREGVYADRIASAWLIRRFIDPEARFKFVSGKATDRRRASCASTCSRRSSRTKATSALSKCCWSAPASRTPRYAPSPRSSTTSTSRTISSVAPRLPASGR